MKQGTLMKRYDDRYALYDENYNELTYFTSGEPLEILISGNWITGRMEHNGLDYYFISDNNEKINLNDYFTGRTS